MASKKTKKLKKQLQTSEGNDLKIAWHYLNWGWRIIFIVGIITTMWFFYKLPQWLFG